MRTSVPAHHIYTCDRCKQQAKVIPEGENPPPFSKTGFISINYIVLGKVREIECDLCDGCFDTLLDRMRAAGFPIPSE